MCDSVAKNSSKSIEGKLTSKKKERERERERERETESRRPPPVRTSGNDQVADG